MNPSDIKVYPGKLSGTVQAPPSKSISHRAVICGSLSGHYQIPNLELLEDVQATIDGMKTLYLDDFIVDCKESASTLRFLMPIMAALGKKITFTAGPYLAEQTIEPFVELLQEHGVTCSFGFRGKKFPIRIEGKLTGDKFAIPGDVSSQFICGLLMALPLLGRDADVILTTPPVSRDSIHLTIDVMNFYGVKVLPTETGWHVPGRQGYVPGTYWVEGDYTNAAYFLCADMLPGGNVRVLGLSENSKQGDRVLPNIIPALGAGLEVDARDLPDSLPVLAVMAAYASGKTTFFNVGQNRQKGQSRQKILCENINKLGGHAEALGDKLCVNGANRLSGGVTISSCGDHRIVMAMAIGALRCEKPVTITDAQAINKSYPKFFDEFRRLGGVADWIKQ